MIKKVFNVILLLFHALYAIPEENIPVIQVEKLPQITSISQKDPVYKDYCFYVEENYKSQAKGQDLYPIFFKFTVPQKMTLLQLYSALSIPYDTIATLNNISSMNENIEGRSLILPAMDGLFVTEEKTNNEIQLLLQERFSTNNQFICYNKFKVNNQIYTFVQAQRFSPVERSFFLDTALALPLDRNNFYISSEFGKRRNPFSNEWKDHNGIDFAASEGTPVKAVKKGTVSCIVKNDRTFGNYIILSHDGGKMTSVYAHLSKINTSMGAIVQKGEIIGLVGSTGMVTGPHLHFEIRNGGIPENPTKILRID